MLLDVPNATMEARRLLWNAFKIRKEFDAQLRIQ